MAASASPGPSQTGSVIACAVVMFVLSTMAFGLRAYTRFFITHVASYEELLLGVALSLSLASSIGTIQRAYYFHLGALATTGRGSI
ncbi:hypothetical protein N0V88_004915 [Collariella sp. IMI 366227]|nr:hypothetical protein N0V88_004915 [Collariella sp. IMI 366227]